LQARAIRPSRGPADRRRTIAAVLSALYPGLGQAFNRDPRYVVVFGLPLSALAVLAMLLVQGFGGQLLPVLVKPDTLLALLFLNGLLLTWRLFAVGQAFVAGASGPIGRVGATGLLVASALTVAPQVGAGMIGWRLYETARDICVSCSVVARAPENGDSRQAARGGGAPPLFPGDDPGVVPGPTPQLKGRLNILLIGVDSRPSRDHALTDTMIVASVDPVGETLSMLSVPRDIVDMPLPNGQTYPQKINSMLSHVNANPDDPMFDWANGSGTRALQDSIGTMLGVPIHYYAKVDLPGFIDVVDALGGINVNVPKPLRAPGYADFGLFGFTVEKGRHHFDGREALAYARIRKAVGESDFTRAERQQQVIVALRAAALEGGALGLLGRLNGLLDASDNALRTDVPPEHFSDLALLAEQIDRGRVTSLVLQWPFITEATEEERGYVEIPDIPTIQEMARRLFPPEGTPPEAWVPEGPITSPSAEPTGGDASPRGSSDPTGDAATQGPEVAEP